MVRSLSRSGVNVVSLPREASNTGEDLIGCLGPDVGLGLLVSCVEELLDGILELSDAAVTSSSDLLVCELGEESLDLVDPRGVGRREVNMKPRVFGEPIADGRRLVGAVVVHDQMNVEIRGSVGVDGVEELAELNGAMAHVRLADDFPGFDVQRSEERDGAVSTVVVGSSLGLPRPHREQGLCALERLNLRLFVDAQDNGVLRRIKVQADDVANLLDQQRVGRELEGFSAVRFEPEGFPDPADRHMAEADGLGHVACAPVSGSLGCTF